MTAEHWDERYNSVVEAGVSWFEAEPTTSLALITSVATRSASVVDVGGGTSRLVDTLLARGHRDLTVVDLSQQALAMAVERVGDAPVDWVVSDIRDWHPLRTFDVWHDRAVYHFLVDVEDQDRYWDLVRESVPSGGHVVIGTFAALGPETCSGLAVARYSERELVEAMGRGFAVAETLEQVHTTPAGVAQPFAWVVATRT